MRDHLGPVSFHARTRKYDKLIGWHDWSESSVHFGLLGVPLTLESLDNANGSHTIDESFIPVCSLDEEGRLGVVLRFDEARSADDVSAVEIAMTVDEELPELIERLVRLSVERGAIGSYPKPVSCGIHEVALPTGGVWTGEENVMTAFADDSQQSVLEEAQALLLAAWDERQRKVLPPQDPTTTREEDDSTSGSPSGEPSPPTDESPEPIDP